MSKAEQCPSTIGDPAYDRGASDAPVAEGPAGRRHWRSLEELSGQPAFREFLEREFPAYASELSDASRRSFLKIMGASLALAGAATIPGCRRPDHKILTYNRDPEDVIHGKPLFYATAMPLAGGGAEGLLIETHEGRPTKVEGNPLHPVNAGKSSIVAQASVLNLYDPDRLKVVTRGDGAAEGGRTLSAWPEFDRFAAEHFGRFDAVGGRGLCFLVERTDSPSRDAMRDRVLERWPEARWLPYSPIDDEAAREGARIAFGAPTDVRLTVEKAKVILSLDADFLCGEGSTLDAARGFAAGRRVLTARDPMNRLYAVESALTATGGAADHRLRLRSSEIPVYAAKLAQAVLERTGGNAAGPVAAALRAGIGGAALHVAPEWIDAVADDLSANAGASLVLAGPAQPPAVHALAHALNTALGNVGHTVSYSAAAGDAGVSSLESIATLAADMRAGRVQTLVVVGCNPVYDAPADLDFAALYARVPVTIQLAENDDETGALSAWQLNATHYLETWSDLRAADGTLSVVQPMIAPLFGGRGALELLATVLGEETRDPYEIVRRTWRERILGGAPDFDRAWRRTLHDGLLVNSAAPAAPSGRPRLDGRSVASAVSDLRAPSTAEGLEVVFSASPTLQDGRYANNGWLQELPHPVTKVTWDNPALVSPATAEALGLPSVQGRIGEMAAPMATIEVGGRSMELPVWRVPGMADGVVVLTLGHGRQRSGRIGDGAGFNTYAVRSTGGMRLAFGASLRRSGGMYPIACVQDHWTMEDRALLREADLPAWAAHGDENVVKEDAYGREKALTFADRLGIESHTPENVDIYKGILQEQDHEYTVRPQWGMSIDLNTCIGCGTCTIACQAENNIPVVGKIEVNKGREMHWIRVDRYFSGDPGNPDDAEHPLGMAVQPVTCMHCEKAPCETVCPVNATAHGREGTNDMAYNRCIGTRYCSNNCPYKVRRFNFFDYATKRLHGEYVGKDAIGGMIANEHMIPPRLREKIDEGVGEVQTMQYNPDVTVRERGIMEKCSYCIQRINESRVEVRIKGLPEIPDGFFEVACQQACPTDAIVFGDILNPESRVTAMRSSNRTYAMLGYLNTAPRTTYMMRVRNPNPRLRAPVEDPFGHGSEGSHGPGGTHDPQGDGQHDEGHVMSLPVLRSWAAGVTA